MIGILKMYIDDNIGKKLRTQFGLRTGNSAFMFFEEWRNLGQDELRKRYPNRSFYYYTDLLIEAGLAYKKGFGIYDLMPGYDKPVKV